MKKEYPLPCDKCGKEILAWRDEYHTYGFIPHPIRFTSHSDDSFCSEKCAWQQYLLFAHEDDSPSSEEFIEFLNKIREKYSD